VIFKTPTLYFLASGASEGYTPLNAFDGALLQAGIGNTNIIKMSSILPPRCQQVSAIDLPLGALVPAAYASITSEVPGEVISAGVAVALPEDEDQNGLIMEYSGRGGRRQIEEIVRNMAVEGMMLRGWEIKELKSIAMEHEVANIGAALAAIVLWSPD
jgi:arginine decarboxylase